MSVTLINSMGSDLSVVNAARVSFAKESEWDETLQEQLPVLKHQDQKLIAYLAKHNHWTPFAHCFLSFRIKVPMFVAMQLDKHTVGLVTNSVSRRYVNEEPEFWFPTEWRGKPVNAKQGSSDTVLHCSPDGYLFYFRLEDSVRECLSSYECFIQDGVAPEQARMCLPMNTMIERIWSGSLAAFARVCKLRLDPHAQQETREVAQLINDSVPKEFAHSWKALLA